MASSRSVRGRAALRSYSCFYGHRPSLAFAAMRVLLTDAPYRVCCHRLCCRLSPVPPVLLPAEALLDGFEADTWYIFEKMAITKDL